MIRLADPSCQYCGGTGHIYEDADALIPIRGRTCICVERSVAAASRDRRIAATRLPKRYLTASVDEFDIHSQREINVLDADRETTRRVRQSEIDKANVERVRELAAGPLRNETVVFTGPFGVGKTYLAACLLVSQVRDHAKTGLYVTSLEYIRSFMPGGAEPEEARALRAAAASVDVLLLDELGVEKASAFAMRELWDLLNARNVNDRATIVTSNLSIADAIGVTKELTGLTADAREAVEIGRRIFSRLAENRLKPIAWPEGTEDHRLRSGRSASREDRIALNRDVRFPDNHEVSEDI